MLSHFTARETEPKRLSDLLKATQLGDDNEDTEAPWASRSARFSQRRGNQLISDAPAETVPPRLRRPVGSSPITSPQVHWDRLFS